MYRYPAAWGINQDPDSQAYGEYNLEFPDFPDVFFGVSSNLDDAMLEGEEMLCEFIKLEYISRGRKAPKPSNFNDVKVSPGRVLVAIPLMLLSGHPKRVNMLLDQSVVEFMDGEAKRREMTRTAYVEWVVRRIAQMGG